MKISEILRKKRTISFEFFPPTEEQNIEILFDTVKKVKKYKPDFVSITDSKTWGKTKHIALSRILSEKFSLNTMIHLTCVDSTEKEIKSIIKQAVKHGIDNILALKGDEKTRNVNRFFKNSLDLLPLIPPNICKGIALYPAMHPDTSIQREIDLIKKKIDLGAEFGITQMFFDINEINRFIKMIRKKQINIPIIAGIMPITSYRIFKNIVLKTKNISIPKKYLKIVEKYSYPDKKTDFFKSSIDYTSQLIEKLIKTDISGIHFFTLNRNKGIEALMKKTLIWKKLNCF